MMSVDYHIAAEQYEPSLWWFSYSGICWRADVSEVAIESAVSYQDFVWRLCKPANVLLSEMTEGKVHIWHMASAIPGEAAELTHCVQQLADGQMTQDEARENVTEELGDLAFFITGLGKAPEFNEQMTGTARNNVQAAFDKLDLSDIESLSLTRWNISDVNDLRKLVEFVVIASGDLFDTIKQYVIYNKDFHRPAIELKLRVLRHTLDYVRTTWCLTEADIEAHNRAKLQGRFNKLTYSDAEAHDRADKK